MTAPLVSILIPCYNARHYIGETLESVLRQSWPNLEIIVVDDGSTDGSVKTVNGFRERGVRLIEQINAGAAAARNTAYRASNGQFVQFLDADDLLNPQKIERQLGRMLNNAGCIASAQWSRFQGTLASARFMSEPVWSDHEPLDWLALSRQSGGGMLFPALWLLPRAIIDATGPWNESLSLGDDAEYFTRILLAARRVLFCQGARCYYRSGNRSSLSGRKTAAAWASQFNATEFCQNHLLARENSDRMRRGLALSWQHLAHAAYPYQPQLAALALKRAAALHDVQISPAGGPAFQVVSGLFGWRLARRLQIASGRS